MTYPAPQAPATLPKELSAARVIMWVQFGFGVLGSALFLLGLAALLSVGFVAGAAVVLVLGFVAIAMTVLIGVCAATLKQGRKWTLYATIVAEVLMILNYLNALFSVQVGNTLGSVIGLVLAAAVLGSLLRPTGRAFFRN